LYIDSRTDLKPGTIYLHGLTRKYLTSFFGEQKRLDEVTRAEARAWVTALTKGQLTEARPMAPPTVRGHVVNAKSIFRRAVEDDILLLNPFDRVTVTLPKMDKNWHYVSMQQFEQLIKACKTIGWKRLIGLCRLAGLRRGEAMKLPWSGVDLENRRLTVFAEKTSQRRTVPIVPRLLELLTEPAEARNAVRVCEVNPHCVWRNFSVLRARAGLPRWDDAFQVMRRNCETDWAQSFPQYVVSEWLGHDITVSAEHYLSVPAELYLRASGLTPAASTATQSG
jgi:integrase